MTKYEVISSAYLLAAYKNAKANEKGGVWTTPLIIGSSVIKTLWIRTNLYYVHKLELSDFRFLEEHNNELIIWNDELKLREFIVEAFFLKDQPKKKLVLNPKLAKILPFRGK